MTPKKCGDTLWNQTTRGTDQCVVVQPDKDADGTKHNVSYPFDYGETCASTGFEPGSYACTKVEGKTHAFDAKSDGYNAAADSAGWCSSKFCWVDPCNCNSTDIGKSSWIKDVFYSYQMCGADDTYTPTACDKYASKTKCDGVDTCKWVPPADEDEPNATDSAMQASVLAAATMSLWAYVV